MSGTNVGTTYSGGYFLNQSGIGHNSDKYNNFPLGFSLIGDLNSAWAQESQSETLTWQGPWSKRYAFVDWALGYSFRSGTKLKRIMPAQHPIAPWLYAVDVKMVGPLGAIYQDPFAYAQNADGSGGNILLPMVAFYDSGFNTDGQVRLVVTYKSLPYEIRSDDDQLSYGLTEQYRWVERFDTRALSALPIPGWQLKFAEGPNGVQGQPISNTSINRNTPTKEVVLRWWDVPDVPEDALDICEGSVNQAVFDAPVTIGGGLAVPPIGGTPPNGFEKETLLMMSTTKRRYRSITGRVNWVIEYRFIERRVPLVNPPPPPAAQVGGWNHFPAADGNFYRATVNGQSGGNPFYKQADFTTLFALSPAFAFYQGNAA